MFGRQEGFADVTEAGDQQVRSGRHYADPEQFHCQKVSQRQVAAQQRQQTQADPHRDDKRNQPGEARRALQLKAAAGTAIAQQGVEEHQRNRQCRQAIDRNCQCQAAGNHTVDSLLRADDHQCQRQGRGEAAQCGGDLVRNLRQAP